MAEKTPVAVLTGFLGSGKTTLLSHLLAHPEMGETAVIVNELGDPKEALRHLQDAQNVFAQLSRSWPG